MDERSFGELSKRVAAAGTRRGALRALAAGVAAAVTGAVSGGEPADASFGFCRIGGFPCSKNHQCCTNKCLDDGTCSCAKKGKPCINKVGVNCCSRKCKKGRCK